jgi:Prealbumin-like fold domain
MTQKVLGPSGSKRRRTRLLVLTLLAASAFAVMFVGASSGTLSGGSTFESGDGDLAPNTSTPPAPHDWNAPVVPIVCGNTIPSSGTNCGLDLVKSQADNSLGQGSKEDDPNPTVVSGQVPPSKDDLSRFYINQEKAGGNDYLYLAWERSNLLGSAHMDFEFNQSSTLSANGVTPQRTAGDLLIDYDFGGSGVPVLQKHTWITTGNPTTDCEVSNSLPCWDKAVNLGAFAESAVNNAPVVDTNPPSAPRTLDGNTKNGINSTFGEAGINLTGSGIFPSGTCKHFGAAYLKSRSSGNSFGSELKDFIAPIPVNISNCGRVKIIKRSDPRGINQDFGFTSDIPNPTPPVTVDSQPFCQTDTSPSSFTLNDNGNTTSDSAGNTEDCVNVLPGTYHVTETTPLPNGFVLESLVCSTGGVQDPNDPYTANITVTADETVTCVYTDKLQLGAIKVTKTRKHAAAGTGDHPHAGVSFTVNSVTKQTDANGVACFDGLPFATYTVHETVPAGYHVDGNDKQVTVDNNAACSDSPYVGETVSFHNTPLTDITVSVNSQVDGGTSSTVTNCVSFTTGANGDGSGTASDLEPGTYTCTVVIDP